MDFDKLKQRGIEIRRLYEQYEAEQCGRSWSRQEFAMGYVSNVGDLMRVLAAKEGVRQIGDRDVETALKYELADNLWSLVVLADMYQVDLADSFMKTMDHLENWVGERLKKSEISETEN